MNKEFDIDKLIKDTIKSQDMIKSGDIPNIDLYMDQVTTFMDSCLSGGRKSGDEKTLTKTMINNYAKNNLFPSPEKKKYTKDHLILLIFIYYLKNVLSINDIKKLLDCITGEYFGKGAGLTNIYDKLYECRNDLLDAAEADMAEKLKTAQNIFDENDYKVQTFFLIIMLTFDITLKKQLIETAIAGLSEPEQKEKEKEKKDGKNKDNAE